MIRFYGGIQTELVFAVESMEYHILFDKEPDVSKLVHLVYDTSTGKWAHIDGGPYNLLSRQDFIRATVKMAH